MWRFVLVASIVLAVSLLLWSTWRLDRRLFATVSVGLAVFGVVFGFGAWQGSQQALIVVPHDKLTFNLESATPLETGVRIKGHLYNNEAVPIATAKLSVSQQVCNDSNECQTTDTATIIIRRHLNPSAEAPISEVVRLADTHNSDTASNYVVTIIQAKGYKQAKGQSGLSKIK